MVRPGLCLGLSDRSLNEGVTQLGWLKLEVVCMNNFLGNE